MEEVRSTTQFVTYVRVGVTQMSCDPLPWLQLMMLRSHVNSFGIVQIYTVFVTNYKC